MTASSSLSKIPSFIIVVNKKLNLNLNFFPPLSYRHTPTFWSTSKHIKCMCMFSAHHSNTEHQPSVDSCFQHGGSDLIGFRCLFDRVNACQFTLQLWLITRPATAQILNFNQRLLKHKRSDTKLQKLLTEVISKTFVAMPISPTKILIFVARSARPRDTAHA